MAAALCAGMVGLPLIALAGSDGGDPVTAVIAADENFDVTRDVRERASRSAPPTTTVVPEAEPAPVVVQEEPVAEVDSEPAPAETTTTVKRTTTTVKKRTTTSTTTTAKARASTASSSSSTTSTTAAPEEASSTGNVQEGDASYYENAPAGTCAHRTAPKGTVLTVTNLDNGKSTTCKVADRGPYVAGRVVDLSKASFSQIAPLSAGVIRVRVEW